MTDRPPELTQRGSAEYAVLDPLRDPGLFEGVTWRRIFAYMVDLVVIAGLLGLYYIAVALLTVATFGLVTPLLFAIAAALPIAYHTLTIGGPSSATLGMRLFRLQVSVWNGGKPGYLQALLHTAVFYVTTGFTVGLILLWALFNNRRRCLHDILCGMIVHRRQAKSG
ncbi:MAG TPA: RDD family protein [Ferrovibrio sp.]|uniref:RDD family protein n=1 Tax=Ferrovibrio sp. TaxID=1917215 RepID=UPI002ED1BD69